MVRVQNIDYVSYVTIINKIHARSLTWDYVQFRGDQLWLLTSLSFVSV